MEKWKASLAGVVGAAVLFSHPLQNEMNAGGSTQDGTAQNWEVSSSKDTVPAALIAVIDGDTIKVQLNGKVEKVRYLLIDTPESKKPGMCVQPYAEAAWKKNEELVKSGSLTLEFEKGKTRDHYGRLLAYVFANGMSVQETLVQEGLARVGYIMEPPSKYLKPLQTDQIQAQKKKLNIWSRKGYVTKWGFKGCAP